MQVYFPIAELSLNVALLLLLRIPTRIVIGTSTFQILCVTAFTTVLQAAMNFSVDLLLSVPLMLGSVVGAQFGVSYAERFKAEQLRALLALIVLGVAARMALGFCRAAGGAVQPRCAALKGGVGSWEWGVGSSA